MRCVLLLICLYFPVKSMCEDRGHLNRGHVSVGLSGQFGNQLFEIATAYAYSLDNNLILTVPDLQGKQRDNILNNAKELFFSRINAYDLPRPPVRIWREPTFNYSPIPSAANIELHGYFQSEKYFKHRKEELLKLFAAPEGYNEKILNKYPFLATDALVVGVQVRDYRKERPTGAYHPTLTRSYYAEAIALFPDNAIFMVSSNNINYARACTEGLAKNIIYLENSSKYIEEFYTLILCKSFIISNSSFGWWAAWLSMSSNKTVVAPSNWFAFPYKNELMIKDLVPSEWVLMPN